MRASLPDAASASYSTGMDKGRWVCGYEGCQSAESSMVGLNCLRRSRRRRSGAPLWFGGFAIGRAAGWGGWRSTTARSQSPLEVGQRDQKRMTAVSCVERVAWVG